MRLMVWGSDGRPDVDHVEGQKTPPVQEERSETPMNPCCPVHQTQDARFY